MKQKYRYDKTKTEVIECHVKNMLKDGIIQKNGSTYYFPVVLWRKNIGKRADSPKAWRLSIEYRKLNSQTFFHNYPMPHIQDLLHGVKGYKIKTTLVLTPCYHQIVVRYRTQKLLLMCHRDFHDFWRMSFGLSSATGTSQIWIDHAL